MNSEIERLAKEAGLRWLITTSDRDACYTATPGQIAKLVHLAAEECAKVADSVAADFGGVANGKFATDFGKHTHNCMANGAHNVAVDIRAKFALSDGEDAAK